MDRPDEEALRSWSTMTEAKYFISLLRDEYEETKEDIINGLYTGDTVDKTAQLFAKAIGKCQELQDVIYILENLGKNTDEDKDEE